MVRARPVPRAQQAEELELVLLNLIDSEDPDDEEAALLLLLSFHEEQLPAGRQGDRGKYDATKSDDFLDVLFDKSTDRIFRSWPRCVVSWYMRADLILAP